MEKKIESDVERKNKVSNITKMQQQIIIKQLSPLQLRENAVKEKIVCWGDQKFLKRDWIQHRKPLISLSLRKEVLLDWHFLRSQIIVSRGIYNLSKNFCKLCSAWKNSVQNE